MQSAKCKVRMLPGTLLLKKASNSVRIVNLYKYLIREHKEYVLSKQLLRCGTSIGANIAEAQRGQSHADFLAKMSIALKEASETHYWLRLLYRTDYLSKKQFDSLDADIQDVLGLLMAICKTANQNK